jgi:hypothetical protein
MRLTQIAWWTIQRGLAQPEGYLTRVEQMKRYDGLVLAGKNRRDIAVQVHGLELDGMARDRARERGEPAALRGDTIRLRKSRRWSRPN